MQNSNNKLKVNIMYSYHKNVQIILALMKKFGISNIVASAGTRNISLVFSALQDDFFKCYSIVDERSAAFFALGLIQTTRKPAAIVCTSGTATCNYLSAVTEAFYQHLPLLVLTSDRNHYYLNQQEDQCIPQQNLYHDVLKKMVDLPIVRDDLDFWYCDRLVNEALLELDHREKGPVQINYQVDPKYPVLGGDFIIDQPVLPNVRKIDRIMADDDDVKWEDLSQELKDKRVLLLYGQNLPIDSDEVNLINDFCERYDVVVANEHITNRHVNSSIKSAVILSMIDWNEYCPDVVITMGGHRMVDPKDSFRSLKERINHWHVSRDGNVSDPFHCQTKIIECSQKFFFRKMSSLSQKCAHPYLAEWRKMETEKIKRTPTSEDFSYSGVYAIKRLVESIPKGSLLHISNSNSIRLATYFDVPEFVDVYCNRGTCGIDGSLSTYVSQSYITNKRSFMIIGDLSFFYDMNAFWNHYINGNTRVMLINNSGGAILNFGAYKKVNVSGKDVNTAATHDASAKGWVESRGFEYLCAHNKEDFDIAFNKFVVEKSDSPILFEVFTDMDIDIAERNRIIGMYRSERDNVIGALGKNIPQPLKSTIKSILHRK